MSEKGERDRERVSAMQSIMLQAGEELMDKYSEPLGERLTQNVQGRRGEVQRMPDVGQFCHPRSGFCDLWQDRVEQMLCVQKVLDLNPAVST